MKLQSLYADCQAAFLAQKERIAELEAELAAKKEGRGMDDEQQEITDRVAAFFRNWEQFDATDRNPYYRSEAEQALKIAAQLAQVEQAKQLKRIADALEDWRDREQAAAAREELQESARIYGRFDPEDNMRG